MGNGEDLRILLTSRGGGHILAELPFTEGHFTRILDRTSLLEMSTTVGGMLDRLDCGDFDQVVPWATEILVLRDGRDAWCGPVIDVQYDYGAVHIMAQDLSAWWNHRIIPRDLNFVDTDACSVVEQLHDAGMEVDPIANIMFDVRQTGNLIDREYLYAQSEYVYDAIAEIARTEVDWTFFNRTVILGGVEIPTAPMLLMTDDMWQTPPRIRAKGSQQATYVVVNAKENILGTAIAPQEYLDYYGRIERIFDDADIEDLEGANRAAETRLAMLKDPLYIESPQGAALKPDIPVLLEQLIPGMLVRLNARSTCKTVVSDFRLQQVDVNFNGRVQVDMQPVGTVDDGTGV